MVGSIPAAFADEARAVALMEDMRWGDSPCCPRCGSVNVKRMQDAKGKRNARFLWRCADCLSAKRHSQYSWRIGTPAEDSRIPAWCWVYAFWRAATSKKGVAALEIKRQTGLSYKSALFLMHRVRFAMAGDNGRGPKLSGTVEADETYCGGPPRYRMPGRQGQHDKAPVVGAVERGGRLRLRVIARVTASNIEPVLREWIDPAASRLMTDEGGPYRPIGREFRDGHATVNHTAREFSRPEPWGKATTNTIEGAFSLLKRGLYGIWHNVSREHLHRYCAEVEFRYNHRKDEDGERMRAAIRAGEGRHLAYCLLQGPAA